MSAFWIALIARAAASALVVVTASVAAEAAGPFWGGLIVSLPIGAGPVYVMLALEHDAAFIASSALGSLAINAATFVFLAALALLASRTRWWLALAGGLAAWLVGVMLIRQANWDVPSALVLNAVVLAACMFATRLVPRDVASGGTARRRWFELLLRAATVGLVAGSVVTASRALGPQLTGTAAVFPIAFTSFAFVVMPRLSGPATAAIMVSALHAMPGFGLCLLVLHLTVIPFGLAGGLTAALGASLLYSAGLLIARRRGTSPRPKLAS